MKEFDFWLCQDVPTVAQADIYSKTTGDFNAAEVSTSNRERANRAGLKLLKLSEKCRVSLPLIYLFAL